MASWPTIYHGSSIAELCFTMWRALAHQAACDSRVLLSPWRSPPVGWWRPIRQVGQPGAGGIHVRPGSASAWDAHRVRREPYASVPDWIGQSSIRDVRRQVDDGVGTHRDRSAVLALQAGGTRLAVVRRIGWCRPVQRELSPQRPRSTPRTTVDSAMAHHLLLTGKKQERTGATAYLLLSPVYSCRSRSWRSSRDSR